MASLWRSFWRRERAGEKGLSISLDPGGFVTELIDYRRPRYPQAATADLQATQTRNELVYACLAIKGGTAQDPRLIVQKGVRKGGTLEYEEVQGHPFRQLFMRPNPHMTEADLMRAAIVSWDISNPRRFYAEKELTGGLLTAIWPLNPALMRPLYGRTGGREIIGYQWSDGTDRKDFALDDLIIRSAPAWFDPPPLMSALGSVESDSAQTDYVRAFFENGGTPGGLLKYKTARLNDTQRDDIREKWRGRYGNRMGRQHDIGILDADVEYQEIGAPLDKLHSQVLRSVSESRICMVFGVPPLIVYAYVGLIRATYSNLKEAWAGFWDATASPMYKEWRSFFLWNLLTEYEEERDIRSERIRLGYDMGNVAALQEDVDAIQNRARQNFTTGGLSFNEFRTEIGKAPVEGGDDLYAARPMAPLGMTMPEPPQNDGETMPPKRGRKARDSTSVQLTERRIEKAVRSYLQREYRRAAETVRG